MMISYFEIGIHKYYWEVDLCLVVLLISVFLLSWILSATNVKLFLKKLKKHEFKKALKISKHLTKSDKFSFGIEIAVLQYLTGDYSGYKRNIDAVSDEFKYVREKKIYFDALISLIENEEDVFVENLSKLNTTNDSERLSKRSEYINKLQILASRCNDKCVVNKDTNLNVTELIESALIECILSKSA